MILFNIDLFHIIFYRLIHNNMLLFVIFREIVIILLIMFIVGFLVIYTLGFITIVMKDLCLRLVFWRDVSSEMCCVRLLMFLLRITVICPSIFDYFGARCFVVFIVFGLAAFYLKWMNLNSKAMCLDIFFYMLHSWNKIIFKVHSIC